MVVYVWIVILTLFKVHYQYTGIYKVQLHCILPYFSISVICVIKCSVYEGSVGDDYAGIEDCIMAIASLTPPQKMMKSNPTLKGTQ